MRCEETNIDTLSNNSENFKVVPMDEAEQNKVNTLIENVIAHSSEECVRGNDIIIKGI